MCSPREPGAQLGGYSSGGSQGRVAVNEGRLETCYIFRRGVNQTSPWAGYDGREPRKSPALFGTEQSILADHSTYHSSKWGVLYDEFMEKVVRIGSQRCS